MLFSVNFYAQVNFEKSYFIDNSGTKTECFIKNDDRYDTPINFKYKLSLEDSQIKIATIKTIKEFKIGEILKYQRENVKIDTSNVNLDALSKKREPEWKELTVFLKVIIESGASLYEYKNGNIKKYFYKTEKIPVEQLVFKKYIVEGSNLTKLTLNNDFQRQLWTNLNCGNNEIKMLTKLEYSRKDLAEYFIKYNNCKNNNVTNFDKNLAKGSFNFKAKAGLSSSSLSISNKDSSVDADFGNKSSFTFGTELEYIMPFNRNKWSIFLATSYNSYQNETIIRMRNNSGALFPEDILRKWNASFSHLNFELGLKYYMFINDNSKIFINAFCAVSKGLNSDIHDDSSFDLESEFGSSLGYGVGYSFKNKFSIEIKHNSSDIFANNIYWNSKYSMTSLVFGYTVFNTKKKNKKTPVL